MADKYIFPDAGSQLRAIEFEMRRQINLTDEIVFEFPSLLERARHALSSDALIKVKMSNIPIKVGQPNGK